jgi:hypothetical protein
VAQFRAAFGLQDVEGAAVGLWPPSRGNLEYGGGE